MTRAQTAASSDAPSNSAHRPIVVDKIYRLPCVIDMTGLCRSSIYDGVRKGTFPSPVRIGKRAIGWRASDLMKWIDARKSCHNTGCGSGDLDDCSCDGGKQ